jgi:hypothetical protein
MGSYADTAWGYDEESLGLDPETKLKFVPTDKELKLFKEEKTNLYKGTWTVCFIYGLSAIGLLGVVFLTDWGRTYVYEKFLPAVLTYVLGALLIIFYLVFSIFTLKPRKIRTKIEPIPICPDYWKLEQISKTEETNIMNNIKKYSNKNTTNCSNPADKGFNTSEAYIINNEEAAKIKENSPALQYKCKPDKFVFGDNEKIEEMNNKLYKKANDEESKFILNNDKQFLYKYGKIDGDNKLKSYITYDGKELQPSEQLKKYAQISGLYKYDWEIPAEDSENIAKYQKDGDSNFVFPGGIYNDAKEGNDKWGKYPIICNQIYPGILDELEKEKGDKLKCELSKVCGISWSKLDCYDKNPENKSLNINYS